MTEESEQSLVRSFFPGTSGFFVEVGANDPKIRSQSWHLEQSGWDGVLVEPLPEMAQQLRQSRRGTVFAAACSSPENAGRMLPFHVAGPLSSLDRSAMAPGSQPETTIEVQSRTLDDILLEARAPQPLDFLSVDVEGHEIDVLRGFNFGLWLPRLILLEDHVSDLRKHKFLKASGYRLIRRTGHNGWYVPQDAAAEFGWWDRWHFLRKYYLALPFRILRNLSRRLRQPRKDAARLRHS